MIPLFVIRLAIGRRADARSRRQTWVAWSQVPSLCCYVALTGEAFERGRDFGAWLGLVPRQYSTGGRSILGHISNRGSKYLRNLFIQAANVILMRPHNWGRFSFGAWLQNAAPRLHRNKLATALANKLARIAWSILRNEKTFDAPHAI